MSRMLEMKFAVITDIHGNYPVLKAVFEDFKMRGITKYIFEGGLQSRRALSRRMLNCAQKYIDKYIIRGNE